MNHIDWQDFQKVELRIGTVVGVENFPEARKAAFKLKIDFGQDIGIRKSSAQVTDLYTKDSLLGKQVVAVVNFSPKQIGPIIQTIHGTIPKLEKPSGNANMFVAISEEIKAHFQPNIKKEISVILNSIRL